MKNKYQLIIGITLGSIILISLWFTFREKWQIDQANQLFSQGDLIGAKPRYAQLTKDLPKSPFASHNFALCLYQTKNYPEAVKNWTQTTELLAKTKKNSSETRALLVNHTYYHQGNTFFQQATEPETATPHHSTTKGEVASKNLFTKALASYQKAITADPTDIAAKYNYELTRLRLKDLEQKQKEKESPKKESQNDSKQSPEKAKQNNQQKSGGQEKSDQNTNKQSPSKTDNLQKEAHQQQQKNTTGPQKEAAAKKQELTRAQAEALLQNAANNELYQGPLLNSNNNEPTAGKDW